MLRLLTLLLLASPLMAQERQPATAKVIDFRVEVSPKQVKPGGVAVLKVTATPIVEWHTYSAIEKSSTQNSMTLTKLTLAEGAPVELLQPIREKAQLEPHDDGDGGKDLISEAPIVWELDLFVPPDAKPGPTKATLKIKVQVCKESCLRGEHLIDVPLEVLPGPAEAVSAEVAARRLKPPAPPRTESSPEPA